MASHSFHPVRAATLGIAATGALLAYVAVDTWLAPELGLSARAQSFNTRSELRRGTILAADQTGDTAVTTPLLPSVVPAGVRPSLVRVTLNGANKPGIEGNANPGSTIDVTIDGATAGRTAAGTDGRWRIELERRLAAGDHRLGVSSRRDGDKGALVGSH